MLYEWLQDYQKIEEEIAYLEFELNRNKKELSRWMYGDLEDVKLNAKSKAAKLEEIIRNIEHELAHKMNDLYDAKKLISKFKGLDNQILYGKYVEGKTLTEIAYELGYTPGHIYNKHAQIVKMIDFALHVNLT
jgi:DNA-directed RNA polymerase specialized sigma subunit